MRSLAVQQAPPAASRIPGQDTRERLLEAAAGVFAARGYRGATLREITVRARVNLAAAHYHFGSKEELYLAVARRYFEELEARLAKEGAVPPGHVWPRSRQALEDLLERRIRTLLELLLEDPGGHVLLMLRELCDPGEGFPEIVRRFVDPQRRELEALVSRLEPSLPPEAVSRCARSIVGQAWFYATHRPALLLLLGRQRYPRGFAREMAAHILRFSLGGLGALASRRSRRPARRKR